MILIHLNQNQIKTQNCLLFHRLPNNVKKIVLLQQDKILLIMRMSITKII